MRTLLVLLGGVGGGLLLVIFLLILFKYCFKKQQQDRIPAEDIFKQNILEKTRRLTESIYKDDGDETARSTLLPASRDAENEKPEECKIYRETAGPEVRAGSEEGEPEGSVDAAFNEYKNQQKENETSRPDLEKKVSFRDEDEPSENKPPEVDDRRSVSGSRTSGFSDGDYHHLKRNRIDSKGKGRRISRQQTVGSYGELTTRGVRTEIFGCEASSMQHSYPSLQPSHNSMYQSYLSPYPPQATYVSFGPRGSFETSLARSQRPSRSFDNSSCYSAARTLSPPMAQQILPSPSPTRQVSLPQPTPQLPFSQPHRQLSSPQPVMQLPSPQQSLSSQRSPSRSVSPCCPRTPRQGSNSSHSTRQSSCSSTMTLRQGSVGSQGPQTTILSRANSPPDWESPAIRRERPVSPNVARTMNPHGQSHSLELVPPEHGRQLQNRRVRSYEGEYVEMQPLQRPPVLQNSSDSGSLDHEVIIPPRHSDLWALRATFEEEEDLSDAQILTEDMTSPDTGGSPTEAGNVSQTTSFESEQEGVAEGVHSIRLSHRSVLSRRGLHTETSVDSGDTNDTDGNVSDISRQEMTTTSFDSGTTNTDSNSDSAPKLQMEMRNDSGYRSIEAQQKQQQQQQQQQHQQHTGETSLRPRALRASKKRQAYGRLKQAAHIVGESVEGKSSVFMRFFRPQADRAARRDYSIDSKSNELYQEFTRYEPEFESRRRMYSRTRMQHSVHADTTSPRVKLAVRSLSVGSDSSNGSGGKITSPPETGATITEQIPVIVLQDHTGKQTKPESSGLP